LQRFYVGRVKTGLLWLLTFGLFGIGQIVDMIMIALGQFRDSDGKRVLDFTKKRVHTLKQPVNQYSAIVRDKWTDSRVGFKLGNLVFNLLGGILLLGSLAVGAVVSVGIPEAIAAGAFGNEVAFEIAEETQVHDWDKIATAVMGVATIIAGTLAATCLLFARRESNWGHLFRIPVAAAAFVGSVISLGATTNFGHRWHYVAEKVNDRLVGGAFEMLFGNQFWPPFVFACLLFIAGVFIMAWPARAKATRTAPTPAAKHAREGHTV
jgi:hypothetical protein